MVVGGGGYDASAPGTTNERRLTLFQAHDHIPYGVRTTGAEGGRGGEGGGGGCFRLQKMKKTNGIL